MAEAWARHPLVAMARHRSRYTFFQGLHTMLKAGLPLSMAFLELSRGAERDPFRRAVAEVGQAVEAGSGLAEAMRRTPGLFGSQVVETLAVGELAGTLEGALARVLEDMEAAQELRRRTVALCVYPAYLLGAFLIGGSLLQAAGASIASGGAADLTALILGALFRNVLGAASAGAALFAFPLAVVALGVEEPWERFRARVPLLGRVHAELHASRFCQSLGSALGAGLDAARSLQLALEATGSPVLRARAAEVLQHLDSGASLTEVVSRLGVLDGDSLRQLSTGERAGRVPAALSYLARALSESAMRRLRTLVVLLIVVGATLLILGSVGQVIQFQRGYYQQIESLGQG
jgi:type II secretory pathway component PulF